jgi:hypothetical protein
MRGLFALFIVGVFLYGTYEMNRGGARAVAFNELRGRILKHVAQHQEPDVFTLDDLEASGVVTGADRKFLDDNGITYHPVGAGSPKDAVCFVQRQRTQETRYFKDGRSEYYRHWTSPDERHTLTSGPKPGAPKDGILTLVERATGKTLHTQDILGASAGDAQWSPDSRYAAVAVHRHKGGTHHIDCEAILEVSSTGVRALAPPAGVRADHNLPAELTGKDLHWHSHWALLKGWRGDVLRIETHGQGRIGAHDDPARQSFNFIYSFEIQTGAGNPTIVGKSRRHSVVTPRAVR